MPTSNTLNDVTTKHNTNKRSEEEPVANDDDEQDTNKQSQEVPVQLQNSAPAIDDDDAKENRKVMEDDTHNNNDTDVPEANHTSSDSINSEAVSSIQVHSVHSTGPILKKVATDDTEKIQKAWAAGDGSTSNDKEGGFTPFITKNGKKTQVKLDRASGTHNTRSRGHIPSSSQ